MAHWSLDGVMMNCQLCGAATPRKSFSQRYCKDCRRIVANAASDNWKRTHRVPLGRVAPTSFLNCQLCGVVVERKSAPQKFCKPCRKKWDDDCRRNNTRKYRLRGGEAYKAKAAERLRLRRAHNPKYAISARMSAAIYQAFKGRGGQKKGKSWESLVGYTAADLACHIERQFGGRMGWHNMGEWHIDHIQPIASFTFETPDDPEFKVCWGLTNLRPIWAKENFEKSSKRLLLL